MTVKKTNYFGNHYLIVRQSKTQKPVIVVSKKISNKAVVRNRLRRQIKELLRQHRAKSVIVKVTRLPKLEESFKVFERDLELCLPKQLPRL